MATVVTRNIPQIVLIDREELGTIDRIVLSTLYKTGIDEFVICPHQKETIYLVAYEKDILAGYCGLLQSFDEADITNVAVVEKFRKKGVATELLEQLFLRGYERGIENFTLEVRVGNAPAIHLYEKLGFERSGIRPNFYEKPKEDALIMWKYGNH